jgi:hypothetical protein
VVKKDRLAAEVAELKRHRLRWLPLRPEGSVGSRAVRVLAACGLVCAASHNGHAASGDSPLVENSSSTIPAPPKLRGDLFEDDPLYIERFAPCRSEAGRCPCVLPTGGCSREGRAC